MKHSVKEWILATRPWSFPASAMPVVVTVIYMFSIGEKVNWWLGLWALLNIVIVHASGNVWSDYFDFKKKVDQEDTYGTKILTSGQFEPKDTIRLSVVLQVLALIGAAGLFILTGWELVYIVLAGVLLSLLYPPLKYIALGDVVIYFCYGFLPMLGTSFIVTGQIHWEVLWLSVPVGLITISILHANNTRDIETDKRAKIKTFAMLIGRSVSLWIYCFEVVVPFIWITVMIVAGMLSWWVIMVWLVFPLTVKNIRMMLKWKTEGVSSYARLDEGSAQLQLAFSVLLSIGLVVGNYLN